MCIRDRYTGKQGLHLAFGLQQTGYQPRKTSGKERHECTDKRVSIHCEYGRYRTSGCKAPVNRQIGNIQNAEGNKHQMCIRDRVKKVIHGS